MSTEGNQTERHFRLSLSEDQLSVCRLDVDGRIPSWATGDGFWAVLRREMELTVVCITDRVPEGTCHTSGWRALTIDATLDFSEVGILADLTTLLARAGVSIFALSTYDTDVVLVREAVLSSAIEVLRAGGHEIADVSGDRPHPER